MNQKLVFLVVLLGLFSLAHADTWYNVTGRAVGGTMTNVGNYIVHSFLTNNTFNITVGNITVDILAVGGGGGGGGATSTATAGGGGGGGGINYTTGVVLTSGTNATIVVGAAGGASNLNRGGNGTSSSFAAYNATGGGGGGGSTVKTGADGGSGGGGGVTAAGGSGSQGNWGGNSTADAAGAGGGGGGTSGLIGGAGAGTTGGAGGNGTSFDIRTGVATYYAGGGGGAATTPGAGGNGGGGAGGVDTATVGTANTGGGGGGAISSSTTDRAGAIGGSGIVVVRYLTYGINATLRSQTTPAGWNTGRIITVNATGDLAGASTLVSINVTVYDVNGTIINSTVSASSPLYIQYTSLNYGRYTLNATATDQMGNYHITTRDIILVPCVITSTAAVTYIGNTVVFNFTNSSATHSFNITSGYCNPNLTAMVVAGGGGGGSTTTAGASGGGGGAGGINYTISKYILPTINNNIVIGAGGVGGVGSAQAPGKNGTNSTFGSLIAIGGGGGGSALVHIGANGGSGGGSVEDIGGTGSQGGDGGDATGIARSSSGGGGGGTAGLNGGNAVNLIGGAGGNGTAYTIYDSNSIYYAGGGGGGGNITGGAGGNGGGGAGASGDGAGGTARNNTGSGGGGATSTSAADRNGGAGASGIIIISYTLPLEPNEIRIQTYSPSSYGWINKSIRVNGTAEVGSGATLDKVNISVFNLSGSLMASSVVTTTAFDKSFWLQDGIYYYNITANTTGGWIDVFTSENITVSQTNFTATVSSYQNGNNHVYRFIGNGSLNITGGYAFPEVEVLAVGGGGSGGASLATTATAGGGGGGGINYTAVFIITNAATNLTIGLGGLSQISQNRQTGQNSTFGTLTAFGGGRGGVAASVNQTGLNGGSGGGGAYYSDTPYNGGNGTAGQGANGGNSTTASKSGGGGGGGGISGTAGGNSSASLGGNGGNGTAYSITGTSVYYAGGGGGGTNGTASGTGGDGGLGGGGTGGISGGTEDTDGTDYLGGGGGAQGYNNVNPGGDGGDGVVIVSYHVDEPAYNIILSTDYPTTTDWANNGIEVTSIVSLGNGSTLDTVNISLYNRTGGLQSSVATSNTSYYKYFPLRAGIYYYNITANTTGGDSQSLNSSMLIVAPVNISTTGTRTRDGGYLVYSFLSNGTFNVTGETINTTLLVVAGGGGSGSTTSNLAGTGGGGGGGINYSDSYDLTAISHSIVIGTGGAGAVAASFARGDNGTSSSFSSLIAVGGGGGGGSTVKTGADGGSGGGSAGNSAGHSIGSQGGDGGNSSAAAGGAGGGGGGTAGVDGGDGTALASGNGGAGTSFLITGVNTSYAGGGGGGGNGTAGAGGGGAGAINTAVVGTNGTGGGAGGVISSSTTDRAGARGGDGIVIVRYFVNGSDNIIPLLTVEAPVQDSKHNSAVDLNYTVGDVDTSIDTCWYKLNGGASQIMASCANQTNITGLVQNLNNLTVYVNDSLNNINSSSVSFYYDSVLPTLTVESPTASTLYPVGNVPLDYTAVDEFGIDTCWYTLNGGTTKAIAGCTNKTTIPSLVSGAQNNLTMYVNDTYGNTKEVSVSFYYGISAPIIEFVPPTKDNDSYINITDFYINATAEIWGGTAISTEKFSIDVYNDGDVLIETCFYGQDPPGLCNYTTNGNITILYLTLQLLTEGTYYYNATVTDDTGQSDITEVRYFTVDLTTPALTVESPVADDWYFNDVPLDFTVDDAYVDDCWYKLNGGATQTITDCENLSAIPSVVQNKNNITVYVNDTAGNQNSTAFSFYYYDGDVTVTIDEPTDNQRFNSSVQLNYTVVDVLIIDECWYVLNGGAAQALASCANVTNLTGLVQNLNNLTVSANDTTGYQANTSVSFYYDSSSPTITIQAPTSNARFNSSVMLNYTVADNLEISQCWYTLNGGANVAMATCANQTNLTGLVQNLNNLTVYVNDTTNNSNFANLSFYYDSTAPTLTVQSPIYGQTNNNYSITIDINTTVATNLTAFPAMVSLNTSNSTLWNTTTCTNVRFYDSTNTTLLNYDLDSSDVVYCGNATNNATFWVSGNWTSGVLNRIYAYVGTTDMVSGENEAATWTPTVYRQVYHFSADGTDSVSGTQICNGSTAYSTNSGYFGGGRDSGTCNVSFAPPVSPFGYGLWYTTLNTSLRQMPAGSYEADYYGGFIDMFISVKGKIDVSYSGGTDTRFTINKATLNNTWYRTSFIRRNASNITGFVNEVIGTSAVNGGTTASTINLCIGASGTTANCMTDLFNGTLDELRIYNASITDDWLLAEYAQTSLVGAITQTSVASYITYNNSVPLNYTVADNVGLDSCWYTLNGGASQNLASCANATNLSGLLVSPILNNLSVYVNDTTNNTNFASVSFYYAITGGNIFTSMVGGAINWTWQTVDAGEIIMSGQPTNWTWRVFEASSGRKIPNGTATNWTWVNE